MSTHQNNIYMSNNVRGSKMKQLILVLAAIVIVTTNVAAQSYGLGNVDPLVFTKYRVPETGLSSLWFTTNLGFNSYKQQHSSPAYYSGSSSYTSTFNYSLSPKYYFLKENDERRVLLDTRLTGSYHHDYSEENGAYDNKLTETNLDLLISGVYNNYLSPGEMFLSMSTDVQVVILDSRRDEAETINNRYTGTKTGNYNFSLGIGWGKLRNVTPVVSAIRFQERMKQLNLINNDLSEKAIGDLAQQFSKSIYYPQVYSRSDKYFWQDIEKTLNADGITLQGINQYGSAYLREAPNEVRFFRSEGLEAGFNVGMNYQNDYASERVYPNKIIEQFTILGDVHVHYSHQLNLDSQLRCSLSLSGGPNVTKSSTLKQQYNVDAAVGYDYELTDRVVISAANEFNLGFQNFDLYQYKVMGNTIELSGNYFIEDNLAMSLSYNWNYQEFRHRFDETDSYNTNNLQIGFTYYIDRGFRY